MNNNNSSLNNNKTIKANNTEKKDKDKSIEKIKEGKVKKHKKVGLVESITKENYYYKDNGVRISRPFLKPVYSNYLLFRPYIYKDNNIEYNIIEDYYFDEDFFEFPERLEDRLVFIGNEKVKKKKIKNNDSKSGVSNNNNNKIMSNNDDKKNNSNTVYSNNINDNTMNTIKAENSFSNKTSNIFSKEGNSTNFTHTNEFEVSDYKYKPLKQKPYNHKLINNIINLKLNKNRSNTYTTHNNIELEKQELNISHFTHTSITLGEGYFGKVELVKHKQTSALFALKILKKSKIKEKKNFEHLINEISILKSIDFPFILKIYNTFQDEERLYILTEYIEGGDLMKIMSREKVFSEKLIKFVISQIVLVLEYLHSRGIIYRDIKPENILVDGDGFLKLADFGLSKLLGDSEKDTTKTFCGTPEFISPEILRAENYGKPVDMWSLGVLMYEMYYGKVSNYNITLINTLNNSL